MLKGVKPHLRPHRSFASKTLTVLPVFLGILASGCSEDYTTAASNPNGASGSSNGASAQGGTGNAGGSSQAGKSGASGSGVGGTSNTAGTTTQGGASGIGGTGVSGTGGVSGSGGISGTGGLGGATGGSSSGMAGIAGNAGQGGSLAGASGAAMGGSGSQGPSCEDSPMLDVLEEAPLLLSETGLYLPGSVDELAPGINGYQPRYVLWSDGVEKQRYIYIPGCNTVDIADMDHWILPIGTRIWKEFSLAGQRLETRFMTRTTDGSWLFTTYAWDQSGLIANRVEEGVADTLGTSHSIPPTVLCGQCHAILPERVLGFSAIQLAHSNSGLTLGQLETGGYLSSAVGQMPSVPGDMVASEALGYLHSNCGNCHNEYGVGSIRMRIRTSDLSVEDTDTWNTTVGVSSIFVAPNNTLRIAPGHPEQSVIIYRMSHRDGFASMPPIGSEVVDNAGVQTVSDWIGTIPEGSAGGAAGSGGMGGASGASGSGGNGGAGNAGTSGSSGNSGSSGSAGTAGSSGGGCASVPNIHLTPIVSGLTEPVFITSPPGDNSRLFVVEKAGRIRLIKNGLLQATPYLDIRSSSAHPMVYVPAANAEGGLLGMAFHPQYNQSGRFWLHYTAPSSGRVRVSEFARSTQNPDIADVSAGSLPVRTLVDTPHGGWNHVGGMLAFGADGYLYDAIGDSAVSPYSNSPAKDLSSLLGKILRIDVDTGMGPAGNMSGVGVNPLIWDYGLRNPWRFSFDRLTGDMYMGDVGQSSYEEIDFEPPGTGNRNYGWPYMEANHCVPSANPSCSVVGEAPIVEHSHASGEGGSITGGYVYRGSAIAGLYGWYIYGDFATHRYWARCAGDTSSPSVEITGNLGAPSGSMPDSFGEDANGELYVVMITGEVYRIDAD